MIFGLYEEDNKTRQECIEMLSELAGQELRKEKQLEILENIKEIFGRRFQDVSKNSNGLNAWLNFIDMECEWIQDENSEWAKLVIKSL